MAEQGSEYARGVTRGKAAGREPDVAMVHDAGAAARAQAAELMGLSGVKHTAEQAQSAELMARNQAMDGVRGAGAVLPHVAEIQTAFGHHDVSGIKASVGGNAQSAAAAIGAKAYAIGDAIAFASAPDLHTAAHEAAHVIQQRGGVKVAGGVGQTGDVYEQHADAVADLVVRGQSAEALLDQHVGGGTKTAVQRKETPDGGVSAVDLDAGNREPSDSGVTPDDPFDDCMDRRGPPSAGVEPSQADLAACAKEEAAERKRQEEEEARRVYLLGRVREHLASIRSLVAPGAHSVLLNNALAAFEKTWAAHEHEIPPNFLEDLVNLFDSNTLHWQLGAGLLSGGLDGLINNLAALAELPGQIVGGIQKLTELPGMATEWVDERQEEIASL